MGTPVAPSYANLFMAALEEQLLFILNSRGYKNNVINEAFNKALQYTQHDIFHQEKLNNNTNIPLTFSIPYNTNTTHIGQILRRHWHVIENDPKLKILWPDMPMISYKRNKNIKDILVQSKLKNTTDTTNEPIST